MAKVLKGSSVSLVVFGNQYENNDDRKKKQEKKTNKHTNIFQQQRCVKLLLLIVIAWNQGRYDNVWTFQNQFHGKSKGSVPPFLFGSAHGPTQTRRRFCSLCFGKCKIQVTMQLIGPQSAMLNHFTSPPPCPPPPKKKEKKKEKKV